MASIYRQDVTQTVNPVAADTSPLQKIAQLSAQNAEGDAAIAKTLGEAVTTIANTGFSIAKEAEMQDIRKASEETATIFRDSYVADNYKREIAALEQQPDTPEKKEALTGVQEKLNQLSDAAKGGAIPLSRFSAQVASIAKEAITKWPGRADEIRQLVSKTSGLPGADLYTVHDYVQQQIKASHAGGGEKETMAFVKNDIALMVKNNPKYSEEEYFNMRQSNPNQYAAERGSAYQIAQLKANTDRIKADMENADVMSEAQIEAAIPKFAGLIQGVITSKILDNKIVAERQGMFERATAKMVASGDISNVPELQAELQLFTERNLGHVREAQNEATAMLAKLQATNHLSPKAVDRIKQVIKDQSAAEEARWGDKNTAVVLTGVLYKYREKTVAEQTQLMDIGLRNAQLYGQATVQKYLTNPQQLEKENKRVHDLLAVTFGQVETTGKLYRNAEDKLGSMVLFNRQVAATGVEPKPLPNETADDIKDKRAALNQRSNDILDKAVKDNVLTDDDRNTLKANLAIASSTGNNYKLIGDNLDKYKEKISKLNPTDLAVMQDTVSSATSNAIRSIMDIKMQLEAKHGVNIGVSVNSAGDIVELKQQTNIYGGGAAASQAESTALAEFRNQTRPMLMNLVNMRYAVDPKGDKIKIGREYADVINGKTEYKPFFTLEAIPEQTTKPTGKTATMAQVAAIAARNNISFDDALKQARDQGFDVGE